MRKEFLLLFLALTLVSAVQAQTKGTKIGYIDMEYILQNVPDYVEAQSQLEQKAQKWKQEVETKKIEITKLKDALKAEKALLTKGLIEERTAEIAFLENECLEFQQIRFGPNGDLMTLKTGLTKPIQDQVFSAVQDIAEAKKYDFIFDKTSDLTMLFAAKRFDISDQIVRVLNRTDKREQLTKKQLKEEEAKEAKEEAVNDNPALLSRQQALDAKKATRDAAIADRLALQEQRKQVAENQKLQIVADREAKKNGTVPTTAKTATTVGNTSDKEAALAAATETKKLQADERAKALEIKKQAVDDKKKALEERRLQILADREAKKTGTTAASVNVSPENVAQKEIAKTTASADAAEKKQKQADARARTLEDRKKIAEENKKAQEEKRKQAIGPKETNKTGTVSESTVKEEPNTPPLGNELAKAANEDATAKETKTTKVEEAKQKQAETRSKTLEERNKIIEERKKNAEEKRKKIIEDREAAKKIQQEKLKTTKENTNNN